MTICFYKAQALLWSERVDRIQVDINYKHLTESNEKEILVVWETPERKGILISY